MTQQANSFDGQSGVAIIGASAAGLFAAYLLASRGVKVQVFDAQEELGPPARTLIVTPYLDRLLGSAPEIVANRTGSLRLHSPGKSSTILLNMPDLIIERQTLILWLLQRARAAGAEIHAGRRFLALEPERGSAVLTVEDALGRRQCLRTRAVVAADGASSKLGGGGSRRGQRFVFLRQAIVPLPAWANQNVTEVWFAPDRTRYFFWLIPDSKTTAAVGLIADDEAQADAALGEFLLDHALQPIEYQEAQVPCYSSKVPFLRRTAGIPVFLVGDAAAQVKMTTVGGVVTGLLGAEAAARALQRGTTYPWQALSLRKELSIHLALRHVLNRFTGSDYDNLLGTLNKKGSDALHRVTRDEAARLLWSLGSAAPHLALVALSALLRMQRAQLASIKPSIGPSLSNPG